MLQCPHGCVSGCLVELHSTLCLCLCSAWPMIVSLPFLSWWWEHIYTYHSQLQCIPLACGQCWVLPYHICRCLCSVAMYGQWSSCQMQGLCGRWLWGLDHQLSNGHVKAKTDHLVSGVCTLWEGQHARGPHCLRPYLSMRLCKCGKGDIDKSCLVSFLALPMLSMPHHFRVELWWCRHCTLLFWSSLWGWHSPRQGWWA